MPKTCNFIAPWGDKYPDAIVKVGQYGDGSTAVQVFSSAGEPLATASLCLTSYGYLPSVGCIFVGDYNQHEGIMEALVRAGVLSETGRVVRFGQYNTTAREAYLNPDYRD